MKPFKILSFIAILFTFIYSCGEKGCTGKCYNVTYESFEEYSYHPASPNDINHFDTLNNWIVDTMLEVDLVNCINEGFESGTYIATSGDTTITISYRKKIMSECH
jgi:hypothetical protein|tara:strand:- start:192 stop:506 length:315 start_codon:yes stop_codon:yes gene_type:complete